jgi:hypothetical protein
VLYEPAQFEALIDEPWDPARGRGVRPRVEVVNALQQSKRANSSSSGGSRRSTQFELASFIDSQRV